VSSPIVVPKIQERKKCVRSTKVKFSDPLITTDYNFGIGYHKNNTESITSTALLNVAEQNLCTNKLESKDKGLDFVKFGEKYFSKFTTNKPKDQPHNFYTDPTPKNILSKKNPSDNLTDNNNSNNFLNNFSCAATNHVVVRHDDNNDLLQLHVDHQLKNYDDKPSKNEGSNQFLGISNDISLQNSSQVDNVEIDENESEIIGSRQVVSGYNEIENNQSKLNHHAVCSITQDRISMNLKEGN